MLVFKLKIWDTIYYDTAAMCVLEDAGVGVKEREREGGKYGKGTVVSCMSLSCGSTCKLQDIPTPTSMMGS